jgi:catechol 2,3-dioxygenase-like lactoylglutathione lyase family enzyme
MRLEQIDHVALRCASPEATKTWYVSTLGFEHVFPDQWSGVPIFLRLGSTFIALFPQKGDEQVPAGGRLWHLAFRTATYPDFQMAQAELQARDISFQFRDHEIAHSIYFTDPDGVLLEITTYDIPKVQTSLYSH